MHTSFQDSDTLGKFTEPSAPAPQSDLQQLLAASALIVKLEAICSSGVLSLGEEIAARELIVKAARAFQFDTQAERGATA